VTGAPVTGPRAKLAFGVKINVILAAGFVLVAVVGIFAYRSINVLLETGRREGEALAEIGRLEATVGSLALAVSAQRKYLITAHASDLAEYRAAADGVATELNMLRNETRDMAQRRRLKLLDDALADRLERLDRTLRVRTSAGAAAAAALVSSEEMEELDRRIRAIVQEYRNYALGALRQRRAETEFSGGVSSLLVYWGTVLASICVLVAMIVIRRHQTGRRAAEEALAASEAQLRLVTDAMPALISYVDRDGCVRFCNEAFRRWFGRPPSEYIGRRLAELVGHRNWPEIEPHIEAVFAGRETRFDLAYASRDGRTLDVAVHLVPRRGRADAVTGYYALVTDIAALKEVDRLKNEFVSTVSHELRTPLTSIRGSLGLLAGGAVGALPDRARQLVTIAAESCERLVRLVNDILDTEKMLSGAMEMSLRDVDVGELVSGLVRQNEGFAGAHGVRVRFESGARDALHVRTDPDRLAQVVTNLLSNAIKFSPRDGEVQVRVARAQGAVRVDFSDRGPGVPEQFRPRLFERFAQEAGTRARPAGGTGLGLSICKGIVERLGGGIGYAPREGGGSVFAFELPALEEAAVAS
jgi:PAS domain S-box-containing protein